MKIAIFGGTFDPIHTAHIAVAREAADRLNLDRVLIVPAANPPWKESTAPYQDRLEMVKLACACDARLEASRLEEGAERSFTMETIERARKLCPEGSLYFIIGADAFAEVTAWHRAEELIRAVEFIVIARPGRQYQVPAGARAHRLDGLALRVSSTAIRAALAHGEPPADLDPAVLAYIRRRSLYR
jgi:nicotinate-nucleotide adenylyltransferase